MVDFEKAIKEARQAAQKEAIDELFKHDLGCTCSFCETCRSRFPSASIADPDEFARAGGEHQSYPFDAENTQHLAAIAKSFASVDKSLGVIAGAVSGLRDIFRGRDTDNAVVQSPYRVLVDHLIGRKQAQPTGPTTQRNPQQVTAQAAIPIVTQQAVAVAPMQAQPVQAPLFGQSKRVATDQEMQQFVASLGKFTPKVRFDKPNQWPKESQKGRVILTTNGAGGLGSEVDPDYLDMYADSIEYFANEAKKKVAEGSTDAGHKRDAQYGELEAARYRRVAQMVRAGQIQRIAPAPMQTYSGGGDYD